MIKKYTIFLYSCTFIFFQLVAIHVNAQNTIIHWDKIANGVWKAQVGKPEVNNLLRISGAKPKIAAIHQMNTVRFPLNTNEIKFEVFDGKTYLRFPLDKAEKIFGLGLNFKTVAQRGRILRLHEDHYDGIDNGRSHAPIPFYVSSKGYGIFINSARYIDIWVGTGVSRRRHTSIA